MAGQERSGVLDSSAATLTTDGGEPSPGAASGGLTAEQAGRYEIVREFDRGGQSVVLLAYDGHLGREVAFKQLLAERCENARRSGSLGDLEARFLREARITGQLEHPGIVPVYELGARPDGTLYYTQKLIRGRTLHAALEGCGSLAERLQLLPNFLRVCQAIAYAHRRGVLHRDLKPGNIVMGEFGETVVLDWGLAKKLKDGGADPSQPALESLLDTNSGKTHEGAVLGTPAYMSPEQAVGAANLDERSDVWSLGAILYALLTGRRVFEGETSEQVLLQVATAPVLPARNLSPGAPPELCAVAARALSRNPAERYRDAAALSEDLEAWLAGRAVGVYQYSSWELLRRFVARNRALSIVSAALAAFVFAAAGDSIRGFREGFAERGREQAARARISELEPIIESETDPARLSLLTEELENQVRVLGTLRRLHDSPSDVERAIHAVLASFNADTPAIPPSFVRAVERSIDEIVSDPETPATYARKKQIWPLIKAEFGAQGLPEAMGYIAWTESRFDPEARTPAGSLGIWQFVPGTARQAGLRVDEAVDERRDAARSTRAAARYLGVLIGELGGAESFLLVLQSYNVGESKVRKILHEAALEPGGWRRERRDYFHLYRQKRFPRGEAANYVPKVFAAFLVASDPRKYGGLEK